MARGFILTWLVVAVAAAVSGDVVPPGSDDEIAERLEPFGSLCRPGESCAGVAGAATSGGGAKSGSEVYDTFCFACHSTGVSGAPKFGDATAWGERRDKGMDALLSSTINGFNLMPPRGTCVSCSEQELEAAVNYMLDAAR